MKSKIAKQNRVPCVILRIEDRISGLLKRQMNNSVEFLFKIRKPSRSGKIAKTHNIKGLPGWEASGQAVSKLALSLALGSLDY